MKYETTLQPYGEITEEHPEGNFWAWQSIESGPRGRRTTTNRITDQKTIGWEKTPSFESMGITRYISKTWRVSVKNGKVKEIKTN